MKNLQELKCKGIRITPELKEKILKEIKKRLSGSHDDVLHESLSDIIVNVFTAIDLEKQLNKKS